MRVENICLYPVYDYLISAYNMVLAVSNGYNNVSNNEEYNRYLYQLSPLN